MLNVLLMILILIVFIFSKSIYRNITKRLFDILFSIILIIVVFPVMIIISIIGKLGGEGSVIFKQKRMGLNGREFLIYKFRTMVSNAEEIQENFTEEERIEFEKNYKFKNDKRVTKFGGFLRKTHLDELLQLFNILKGDMSFVGPRPIIKKELEKYGKKKNLLLKVKPGLTGNWACHNTDEIPYSERIKLELYYVENYNFIIDFKIIFLTLINIIKCR